MGRLERTRKELEGRRKGGREERERKRKEEIESKEGDKGAKENMEERIRALESKWWE